jgi:uncharacterized protein involved in cysteine biosynthesis
MLLIPLLFNSFLCGQGLSYILRCLRTSQIGELVNSSPERLLWLTTVFGVVTDLTRRLLWQDKVWPVSSPSFPLTAL